MTKLIAFETSEELQKLTGLTHDELWENGFNLDDWDIGFQSETPITYEKLHWLWLQMDTYCVGFEEFEYNNMYYYLVYHS